MTIKELEKVVAESTKQIAEVWALFKETDKRFKEKIDHLSDKIHEITDQWGRFVENFLVPGIPKVFQERGIPIRQTSLRVKASIKGENMEIDVLAVNTEYVILVEAKNVVKADYVKRHLKKLSRFKEFFPEYKDKKVLGAMAGIEFASESDAYAISEGLFVIALGSDTVRIINPQDFLPKAW
jgi:hypothetical protein